MIRGESKVTSSHLERAAIVYLLSELSREFSQFKDGF